jgi:hypothetical protein
MLTLLSVLFTDPASAGGLGVLASAGAHTEQLYFYANADADGNAFRDLRDYEQYRINETLPNFGGGLELVLGDRDDKIVGNCRLYWIVDAAQQAPVAGEPYTPTDGGAARSIPAESLVVAFRDQPRHLGLGMVGLSWGVIGKPDGFMISAAGHVGSAFITFDHSEFLAADIGPSFSYRAARQVQVFGDLQYMLRYRKGFGHSANVLVGARYLFD